MRINHNVTVLDWYVCRYLINFCSCILSRFESIGHPADRYNKYYDNGENELSPGSRFFQEFDLPSHRLLVALDKLNE